MILRNVVLACVFNLSLIAGVQASSIAGLYNTGVGFSADTQDKHYGLSSTTDTVGSNGYVTEDNVWPVSSGGPWLANTSTSQWLTPTNDQGQSFDPSSPGTYEWTLTFDLSGYDPTTASLQGQFATDNTGVVELNGTEIGTASGFASWATFTALAGSGLFQAGINTLTFVVTNLAQNGGNPTGLRVEFLSSSIAGVPLPAALWLFGSALWFRLHKPAREVQLTIHVLSTAPSGGRAMVRNLAFAGAVRRGTAKHGAGSPRRTDGRGLARRRATRRISRRPPRETLINSDLPQWHAQRIDLVRRIPPAPL
jgi:hypothetical protein